MKYFISIQYDRTFYQIRFSSKSLRFLEERCAIEDIMFFRIGIDRSKKVLAFKPLREETEDAYRLSKNNAISSVDLANILKDVSEHEGLYRYPFKWHKDLGLAIVELEEGMPQ